MRNDLNSFLFEGVVSEKFSVDGRAGFFLNGKHYINKEAYTTTIPAVTDGGETMNSTFEHIPVGASLRAVGCLRIINLTLMFQVEHVDVRRVL